jgi:outer membrane receptor protein involved in Fe transport
MPRSITDSFIYALLCTLCLVTLPFSLRSQSTDVGIITGVVMDASTEQPVPGATVRIVGTSRGAISTSMGRFTVRNVEAGVRSLMVTAVGFDTVMMADVVVSTGKPVTLTIRMRSDAIELKGAVVVAEAFRKADQTITSTSLLTSEEVRRAPGVQEDVIRAVALLPGVAVTAAGRNDLAVRGGAPFENLFLVDNIEVPNINHFGSQGSTGGPLSLINVDLVQDVALSTGGFGPKYGDRLSSVTNLTLRDGNREALSGEVNLSTTGFSLIGEGPLGSRGSFFVAVRRSYLDLIFNLAGFGFVPEYWDLTTKVAFDLDDKNSLSFLLIGALDQVKLNNTADNLYGNSRVAAPSQDQYFSGLTWRHLFAEGFVKTTIGRTYSAFQTIQQDSTGTPVFKADSREGENSMRVDAVWLPSSTMELSGGLIGKYASTLDYDVVVPGYARLDSVGVPAPLAVDTSFTTLKAGLYGQLTMQVVDRLRLSLGGRVDTYNYLAVNTVVSPRLGLTYAINEVMRLSASGGRYFQAPQTIWLIGDPQNVRNLRPLQADQAVLSFEWIPMMDLRVQVETYYKVYDQYPVRLFRPTAVLAPSGFDDINNDIPFGLEPLSNVGTGTAMGVELLVQKKLSADLPIYGLLSVSVNRTQFEAADSTLRTGAFDTPFIGTLALGWRPDSEWELSGKVRTSQGLPTTPFITTPERSAETGFPIGSPDFAYYNQGERLPLFFALDLRVDKRWFFSGWQLITYIDVQNVTGRGNVSGIRYNTQTSAVEQQTSIGVLPSIGINVEF